MRRVAFMLGVALVAAMAAPRRAPGQADRWRLDVDVGASWLRQSGFPESGAGTAGASLAGETDRAALSATLLGACAALGSCSAQAVAAVALHAPPAERARWEVALTVSDLALDRALPVASVLLQGREYLGGLGGGVYVGAGAGAIHGPVTRNAALAELGAWAGWADGRLSATVRTIQAPTSAQLDSLALGYTGVRAPTFTALQAAWSRDASLVSVSIAAGWRFVVAGGGAERGGWASAAVTTWVAPRLAVVFAAGRALEDLTRGVPEERYASVSLRVPLGVGAPTLTRQHTAPRPTSGPVARALALPNGAKRIQVRVAGATRVEMMADFTGWAAVPLVPGDGGWVFADAIEPGPHRLAVRVDGGAWQVPANLPKVPDEFGGELGLITVP